MTATGSFDLDRFVTAQAVNYADAVAELRAGAKQSHWMWYVFPQIAGLGASPMARKYAIVSLDEARAYLAHPLLGDRLAECTALLLAVRDRSAAQVLGSPDDLKLRSSMTLFAKADPRHTLFQVALDRYFGGAPDPATLRLLGLLP